MVKEEEALSHDGGEGEFGGFAGGAQALVKGAPETALRMTAVFRRYADADASLTPHHAIAFIRRPTSSALARELKALMRK